MALSALPLAKLSRPRLHAPVLRERLFRILDQRDTRPVIWVSGPPGSGKTTLVASYVESQRLRTFWYQVDEADKDPATLFYYLGELARQAEGEDRPSLPYLTPEYLADLAGFTRRFFRELFTRFGTGAVLVLDNCHDALGEGFHAVLREALAELPPSIAVIAVSRSGVPAALSRFQLAGSLQQVGWEELRLTADEGQAIAVAREVQALDQVAALNRQVDGWAAGLVLLLAHLKRGGSADVLKSAGSKEAVFEYFAGEIFERATPEHQEVLTRTALLPQFTAQMAAKISGDSKAVKLLDNLYRRQYFIDRRVDGEPTYQYHDLFREFLLTRLEDRLGPTELVELRRSAAEILERQGRIEEAIDLALEAGDYASAGRMIGIAAPGYVDRGRWQQLQRWLQQLPADLLTADPWLNYWLGVVQLPSDPAAAMRTLENAHAIFTAQHDRRGELLSASSIIDSIQYQALEFHHHEPWIRALEALIPDMEAFADRDLQLTAWSKFVLAVLMREPRHRLIEPGVKWVMEELRHGRLPASRRLDAASTLMWYAFMAANTEMIRELVGQVDPLSHRDDMPPAARVWWLWTYGVSLLLANQWEDAIAALTAAKETGRQFMLPPLEWYATVFRAYCYVAIDETQKAKADFDSLRSVADAKLFQATFWYDKGHALLAGHLGQYAVGLEIATRAVAEVDRLGHVPLATTIRCDVVPIAIAAGALELAEDWLTESVEITRGTYIHTNDAALAGGRAYLALAQGDPGGAREHMQQALTLARNPGMRGQLRWAGPGLVPLLSLALEHGIEVELVNRLIRDWRLTAPSTDVEHWPWPIKIRALGTLEIQLDGEPIPTDGKAQHRVLELLKAIVALGEKGISTEAMAECLWPDAEGDAAQASLKTALHRLRKLLRNDDAVRVHDGKITLDQRVCWVDAWAFESLSSRALPGNGAATRDEQLHLNERATELYRGHLLAQESHRWLLTARERLRARYFRLVAALGSARESLGDWQCAARLYGMALEIDPAAEPVHRQLMLCLKHAGQFAEAADAYQRCERTLKAVSGIPPSAETKRVFESLRTI